MCDLIGEGYNKHSGQTVALKKMKFSTVSKGLQTALLREAAVMSKMANASVVRLYDSFQEDVYLYLVMEYAPLGDLEGYMEKKKGQFELSEISHILRELSNGLRFLRSQSIVHRDLKPANILLFHKNPSTPDSKEMPVRFLDLALKLTDFTMARKLDDGELAKTVCGSPLYMAPEVLNRRQYTDKADLWSVGVILYRLIFNIMPFNGLNELDLRDNLNHKPVPIPENDPRLTPALQDLLSGLLQKDPFLRIDWEEFFIHPFLRPPRLGSTIMTDETLSASSFLGQDSDFTSISAQDAIELQRQIRDYETRLQQAQRQVQQLIGDLEQSKLRELLRDQQVQKQPAPLSIAIASPQASSSGNAGTQGRDAQAAAHINQRNGIIKFSSDAPHPPPNASHVHISSAPTIPQQQQPQSTARSALAQSSITDLAISTLSEKLLRLSGQGGLAQSTSSTTSMPTPGGTPQNHSLHGSLAASGPPVSPRNGSNNGSTSGEARRQGGVGGNSPGSGGANLLSLSSSSSNSHPDVVAAQSNIQLLLSKIHPDRAVAIDIVQHLLAEVLVTPDEDLSGVSAVAREAMPLAAVASPSYVPSPSSLGVPLDSGAVGSVNKENSARSAGATSGAIGRVQDAAVASSSAAQDSRVSAKKNEEAKVVKRTHPYGMTPEQAEAWDLERATIVAEGEQWRQLFSNISNDYEAIVSNLNDAKTMVAVLEDDLKEKNERLATFARLEQEYTRSTIYLEDQLRGSRERVSYLEAEFQALDAYRQHIKNRGPQAPQNNYPAPMPPASSGSHPPSDRR